MRLKIGEGRAAGTEAETYLETKKGKGRSKEPGLFTLSAGPKEMHRGSRRMPRLLKTRPVDKRPKREESEEAQAQEVLKSKGQTCTAPREKAGSKS